MTNPKFIPPREDDHDYNPEIDQMIEDRLFDLREKESDIKDIYPSDETEFGFDQPDDLEGVL